MNKDYKDHNFKLNQNAMKHELIKLNIFRFKMKTKIHSKTNENETYFYV